MSSFLADHVGTYQLNISNECGSNADEVVLLYDNRIPQVELGENLSWCEGEIIEFDVCQSFEAVYI
ncbi:MAG: hypothetical protein M3R25_00270 [Bacteroidota bacterium]|nr:hypothetical protein [Bacteroidota bacterium]